MSELFQIINYKEYKNITTPKCVYLRLGIYKEILDTSSAYLYGVFLDRLSCSISNNWRDKNNDPYFIYTNQQIREVTGWSLGKIIKAKNQLIDAKLLKIKRTLKANIMYLYKPVPETTTQSEFEKEKNNSKTEIPISQNADIEQNPNFGTSKVDKSEYSDFNFSVFVSEDDDIYINKNIENSKKNPQNADNNTKYPIKFKDKSLAQVFKNLIKFFTERFGFRPSYGQAFRFKEWIMTYDFNIIQKVIYDTSRRSVRQPINYIDKVLNDYWHKGIKTIEDFYRLNLPGLI